MLSDFLIKMKQSLLERQREIILATEKDQNIDMDGDEGDIIQGNMLAEINKEINSRYGSQLKLISNAIEKIDNGTYGVCEECGEDIPEKRLLFNPYFTNCVICSEILEKKSKGRR